MLTQFFDRIITIPIVDDRAVVAREQDQRIAGELQAVERREDLADGPIELCDGVATRPHGRRAHEARVRQARHVRIVQRKKEEERLRSLLLDEADRFARKDVSHVFVFPQRGLAAGHVADAADAVDDGLVVAVAGMNLEEIGIATAGRRIAKGFAVAHGYRILAIEADHAAVLDVNGGHPVAGRGHDERGIEADVVRARPDLAVPVRSAGGAQAEVPLAHNPGCIAGSLKHAAQRRPTWLDDEGRVAGQHTGAGFPPCILTGEQRVTGGCAGGRRRVSVREPDALACQPVDVRRLQARRAVGGDVAVAQIVGVDEHDVRRVLRRRIGSGECEQERCGDSRYHCGPR